jgi:hypothetical protein
MATDKLMVEEVLTFISAVPPNWRRGNGVRRQPPPSGWALAARHGCILRPASAWRAGDDPVVESEMPARLG